MAPAAPRPALAHDYLLVLRGAERTFAAMADLWPSAPVYTLLYDDAAVGARFRGHPLRVSRLQRLGVRQRGFRALLPAFPAAADRLGGRRHDLVVSSSSAFAHRVRPAPGGVHVCYCHSPFRYAWFERDRALREVAAPLRPALAGLLDAIRTGDRCAARAVTRLVANSEITRARIAEVWDREAAVVHPPVDVGRFTPAAPEDWFLTLGELVPHKQTERALRAARRAGVRLQVVGTGPDRARLEAAYGDRATFLGRVDDDELARLLSRARALVMPNVEEFGIAAVEAQAAGRPVLAVDAGGARETVIDGETGVRVPAGDDDALAEALREVDFGGFDPAAAVANARRFSTEAFGRRLRAEVEAAWAER